MSWVTRYADRRGIQEGIFANRAEVGAVIHLTVKVLAKRIKTGKVALHNLAAQRSKG